MKKLRFIILLLIPASLYCAILPENRSYEWHNAGLKNLDSTGYITINMKNHGIAADGITPNDEVLNNVINSNKEKKKKLLFPSGEFLFKNSIELNSNTIIKGNGAENTKFIFDLEQNDNLINIKGTLSSEAFSILENAFKDDSVIFVGNNNPYKPGDWIKINISDSDLVTSDWAKNSVGQIVEILDVVEDKITLSSKLRIDLPLKRNPYIKKIEPVENVGIECISVFPGKSTAPSQTSNILFRYAVNSWVRGIESKNCTFSHIEAEFSSNLFIHGCYLHDAFGYGGGGRAYGVMLHFMTNECLIENNIFEHLRHSMIVQAGANCNVFALNYSLEPYWTQTELPQNSSGDMVLHGNYVFGNLFEQNICQNVVIDNSHGPNGPYNTFFRNRANLYGIFFSSNNSPKQNIIGNEITNSSLPYILVNYTIQGKDHFLYGNNVLGDINPSGTGNLDERSYAYKVFPGFYALNKYDPIGIPAEIGESTIPAFERYQSGNIFADICSNNVSVAKNNNDNRLILSPNPARDFITIQFNNMKTSGLESFHNINIYNSYGEMVVQIQKKSAKIDLSGFSPGLYFVKFGNNFWKFVKM